MKQGLTAKEVESLIKEYGDRADKSITDVSNLKIGSEERGEARGIAKTYEDIVLELRSKLHSKTNKEKKISV